VEVWNHWGNGIAPWLEREQIVESLAKGAPPAVPVWLPDAQIARVHAGLKRKKAGSSQCSSTTDRNEGTIRTGGGTGHPRIRRVSAFRGIAAAEGYTTGDNYDKGKVESIIRPQVRTRTYMTLIQGIGAKPSREE